MKMISKHLGEVILAVAAVALIVGVVLAFSEPVGNFFSGVSGKFVEIGTGDIWELGGSSGSESEEESTLVPGLYTTGALALYEAGETEAAVALLQTSWEDLLASGAVVVSDGQPILPDNLPTKNTYGFYYGVQYSITMDGATIGFVFNEDGSFDMSQGGDTQSAPAGTAVYSNGAIDLSAMDIGVGAVSSDGASIAFTDAGLTFSIGTPVPPKGTLYLGTVLPDNLPAKNTYGFYYGVQYSITMDGATIGFVFNEDGSFDMSQGGDTQSAPAGTAVYSNGAIDLSAMDIGVGAVSSDGTSVTFVDAGMIFTLGDFPVLAGELLLPDDGSILSIPASAFASQASLTSIIIPSSVTSIGQSAFEGCESLTSITIPFVGSDATGTESALLGHIFGATSYFDQADYIPESLTSVVVLDGMTTIGEDAFRDCNNLTSIVLPASVTTIGASAFDDCTNLSSVTFEEDSQCTTIDQRAFSGCKSLTSIEIPASVTAILGGDNWSSGAFYNCTSLESVTFAENSQLTTIGIFVFYNCTSLTSVEIPASVETISGHSFGNCTSLESVTFAENSQLETIAGNAFDDCTNLEYNEYDNGYYLGTATNPYFVFITSKNDDITDCEINANAKIIGTYAFKDCTSLTSVEIPEGVTTINPQAFESCTSLTSVTFAEGSQLETIGYYAFSGCTSLTSVEIPASVTSIGYNAFSNCTSLESVEIPASVTTIGDWAFSGCTSLESITFAEGSQLTGIADYTFRDCTSLESIELPANVTTIGYQAFYHSGLTSATFANTEGWWCASSATATEGTSIASVDLADASTAATYLNSTYAGKYWKRG